MNSQQSGDSKIQSGCHGSYHWLILPHLSASQDLVIHYHRGLRLCITACDGGPILPNPEEQAEGWGATGKVMISPAIQDGIHIPCVGDDEWYLFDEEPPSDWQPEVFVIYGGFTFQPIDEIYRTFDPTWEKRGLEYLVPIQERFWSQIERVKPVSYIGMGDNDVVVSNRPEFIEALRSSV